MAQFRPAVESDHDQIVQVIRAAFARTARQLELTMENCAICPAFYARDRLANDQAKGRRFYVLEDAGQVVGCVYVRKASDEICDVGRLAVLPAMQGRGYGERLMREAERVAQAAGAKRININAFAELTSLSAWYQSLGYVTDGVENIAVVPRPVVMMHRDLAAGCSSTRCAQSTCT